MLVTSYFWIIGKPNTGGEELLIQVEQEFAGSELQTIIHQVKAELGSAGGTS
ncbi:hypothetical protein PSECIP111951_02424 [Pseudoalteromonas holothuriae]|nr:hypothetical protein [Pseudoalteromonas sp. CIP111951]CAH9061135.1 hypothetical protein PSECIP111951_02424 [Pseudoalteromonas sp. CIP111951]